LKHRIKKIKSRNWKTRGKQKFVKENEKGRLHLGRNRQVAYEVTIIERGQ